MVWVTPKEWSFGEIGITSDTLNQHIRDNQAFLNARQAGLGVAASLFAGETANNAASREVINESTDTFDTNGNDVICLFNITIRAITGTGTPVETSLALEPSSGTAKTASLAHFTNNQGIVNFLTVFTDVPKATYKLTLKHIVPVAAPASYTINWNYLYLAAIEVL